MLIDITKDDKNYIVKLNYERRKYMKKKKLCKMHVLRIEAIIFKLNNSFIFALHLSKKTNIKKYKQMGSVILFIIIYTNKAS